MNDKLLEYLIVTDQVDEFLGLKTKPEEEEQEKEDTEDKKLENSKRR